MKAKDSFKRDQERAERGSSGTSSERKKIAWFSRKKLGFNESVKVRFLWEIGDGIALWRHQRPKSQFGDVSCFRNEEFGEDECTFCSDNLNSLNQGIKEVPYPSRKEYFWLVYNHSTKQVELLSFRDTTYTPVASLRLYEEDGGSVLDRDVIVRKIVAQSRQGKPVAQYLATVNSPSTFSLDGVEVPTREEVVEYLKPYELRNAHDENAPRDTSQNDPEVPV